jgi:hypothetical protein
MFINGVGGDVSKLICKELNISYIYSTMTKDASEPAKLRTKEYYGLT